MIHFNWADLVVNNSHLVPVVTTAISTGVLFLLSLRAKAVLGKNGTDTVPSGSFSLRAIFELITEMMATVSDMVLGSQGRSFVPAFASLFFFILFNNLIGLIPGLTPATDNLNTTLALGVTTFVFYNFWGFRKHGLSYLKQFLGPVIWLFPLFLLIELVSHLVRPLSLGLRLYGNMVGDHTVLGIFLDLVPVWLPVPVLFYFLGIFVCFLQAFVFTILSMIYVSLAISHDH